MQVLRVYHDYLCSFASSIRFKRYAVDNVQPVF